MAFMTLEQIQDMHCYIVKKITIPGKPQFIETERGFAVKNSCDETFKHATAWMEKHGLNVNLHISTFNEMGADCDCEIISHRIVSQWQDATIPNHYKKKRHRCLLA